MYIIWKYDLFPYKLCAKVIEHTEGNYYIVEGYGRSAMKAIRLIKDDKKGEAVKSMLENEIIAKRIEQKQLDDRFNNIVAQSLVNILGL